MKKHIIPLFCALLASSQAGAEDLTTEIDVESSVEVDLPAAKPLPSVLPALLSAPAPEVSLKPALFSEAADYSPLAASPSAGLYTGLRRPDSLRGYLWAGYFPVYNAGVAAGYRIVDTHATTAGVAASFSGSSYHSPLGMSYGTPVPDSKYSVSDNTVGLQAYATHRLNKHTELSADADFFHAALRSADASGSIYSRGINSFDIKLGIAGTDTITYSASLCYSRFGLDKGLPADFDNLPAASDDRFVADIKAGARLGHDRNQHIGLDIRFDLLHRHGIEGGAYTPVEIGRRSTAILSLTPAYTIRSHQFLVRAGVKVDIGIKSDDKAFHLAPDVTVAWMPSARFAAYTTFGGGERFHTLADRYQYSPFAPGSTASARSFTPVDARVGFNIRPVKSFSADIFAGYACTRRMPMLTVLDGVGRTDFVAVDLSGWNFGISAAYTHERYFSIDASARLYPHGYSAGSAEAPDRAKLVVKAGAHIRPIEALTIDLGYELRTGRRYYTIGRILDFGSDQGHTVRKECPMGNVSDLSLGGNYALSETFDVFVRFENLLCRRTMILPSVYSRRLHGLAGISLRF
ncbi:MAG: hypothetical protein NC418_11165 [Muribaculaceae bacterium]|nr:hypothetical protein [Muribaculaceae bacterium]